MTDHDDWLAWRRQGIGGSDIPALLGLSSFGTPYTVWADKMGFLPPSEYTQRQRLGLRLEVVLAEEFHEATDLYVGAQQERCEHPDEPVFRCTLDGRVYELAPPPPGDSWEDNDPVATWQAKTDGRYGWPEGIPVAIQAQCQWELGVTGLAEAWLSVMLAGFRIEHHRLERNDEDIAFMQQRALAFWQAHVLTGEPPRADASEVTRKAIDAVNPEHAGERIDLDHVYDLILDHQLAGSELARATKRRDEIGNQLRVEMGTAEVAMVDGADVLTLHTQTKTSICEHCGHRTESDPYRVLRHVKPKRRKRTK